MIRNLTDLGKYLHPSYSSHLFTRVYHFDGDGKIKKHFLHFTFYLQWKLVLALVITESQRLNIDCFSIEQFPYPT
jgi:hypothetical protein